MNTNVFVNLAALFFLSLIVRRFSVKTSLGFTLHFVVEAMVLGAMFSLSWHLAIATWLSGKVVGGTMDAVCYELARDSIEINTREVKLAIFAFLLAVLPQAWTWPLIGVAAAGHFALFVWFRSPKFRAAVPVIFCTLLAFLAIGSSLHLHLH